jgi:hypothetical protein
VALDRIAEDCEISWSSTTLKLIFQFYDKNLMVFLGKINANKFKKYDMLLKSENSIKGRA